MYYIVFKTTNTVNGKFFIGTQATEDLNDPFLGSNILLNRAIVKHGADKFNKEILFLLDNEQDMLAKLNELVTEDFLSENNTYNIIRVTPPSSAR